MRLLQEQVLIQSVNVERHGKATFPFGVTYKHIKGMKEQLIGELQFFKLSIVCGADVNTKNDE